MNEKASALAPAEKLRATIDSFPGKGFAVVDGGHFDDLPAVFKSERLFARSLFLDQADTGSQAAGPWLAALAQEPDATDKVLRLVGGKPAVVFWCCDAGEAVLWRHLRTLNMARIPIWAANGEEGPPADAEPLDSYDAVMFRHWDPRVLGALMPALDGPQFARILGPATEIVFDSTEYGGVRRVVAMPDWRPAPGMLTIRSEQVEAMTRRRVAVSHKRIAVYLRDVAPSETAGLDDDRLMHLVTESDKSGRELGLKSEQGHARWAYVMARTNGRALQQPGLREYIVDGRVTPDEKVSLLLKTMAGMEARMAGGGA